METKYEKFETYHFGARCKKHNKKVNYDRMR